MVTFETSSLIRDRSTFSRLVPLNTVEGMTPKSKVNIASNKKNKNSKKEKTTVLQFGASVFSFSMIAVIYFAFGSLVLYAGKVGQANVLPSDINCAPFSSHGISKTSSVLINIFTTMFQFDNAQSEKISFENAHNKTSAIADMLRGFSEAPNASSVTAFFTSILKTLFATNNLITSSVLSTINHLPEPAVILVGPILVLLFLLLMPIANLGILSYSWFTNLDWMFKTNSNTGANASGKPVWVNSISIFDPKSYAIAWGSVGCMCTLFWVMLISVFPLIAGWAPAFSIYAAMTSIGVMAGKQVGAFNVIRRTFLHHKSTLASILGGILVLSAFSQLGRTSGVVALLITFGVYTNAIPLDLFTYSLQKNMSPISAYVQAVKTCS